MDDPPPRPYDGTSRAADKIRTAVAASVAAVPVVGGPAAVLFDSLMPSVMAQRQAAWMAWVDRQLARLRDEHGIPVEDLAEDPAFVTATIQATRIALGTHREEKLRLLAGALESAAVDGPEDFWTERCLRWIDELTPEHVALLASMARDGYEVPEDSPDVSAVHHWTILGDLEAAGLIYIERSSVRATHPPTATAVTRRFLEFVRYWGEHGSEPED